MHSLFHALEELDEWLFLQINVHLTHEHLDGPMRALSSLGEWPVFLIAVALLAADGRKRLQRHLVVLLVCVLSLGASTQVLKRAVDRERPAAALHAQRAHVTAEPQVREMRTRLHHSMPSGHAATAFACMVYCALRRRQHRRWALALAIGIGYSRVYVGQHYPTDVVVGAGLGALWAWAGWWGYRRWGRLRPLPEYVYAPAT